jgi:hypothetical protein
LTLLINRIPIASKQSSKIVANQIFHASLNVSPHCPEDTGALRESGRVEAVKEGYAVAYGGPGVDYAAYVHDDLRPNRKYKRPGSGPKFVETHMNRAAESAPPKISAILQELVDGIFKVWRD